MTKKEIAFLRSLHQKKFRQMYGKFLVEGDKLVRELLATTFHADTIYSVEGWKPPSTSKNTNHQIVKEEELEKVSTHQHPDKVVAVATIPAQHNEARCLPDELYLACDGLNDPGNAGTIIRLADWFGIRHIFFSNGSVDVYNPKTVNAAKGSLFRVNCHYVSLDEWFRTHPELPVYGAVINGENVYHSKLSGGGFILIGNEANGISEKVLPYIHHRVSIPSFGKAESLNAAVAAGIIISEFKRGGFID